MGNKNTINILLILLLLCVAFFVFMLWKKQSRDDYPVVSIPVSMNPIKGKTTGRGIRYVFPNVNWEHALHWLAHPMDLEGQERIYQFVDQVRNILKDSPYENYILETPGISWKTMGQPFQFIIIEILLPRNLHADSNVFQPQLEEQDILVLPNPKEHSVLVVPRLIKGNPDNYLNLAAFMRNGTTTQTRNLLRQVAITTFRSLGELSNQRNNGDKRIWISTSGFGVPWLQVRVGEPKDYIYNRYLA